MPWWSHDARLCGTNQGHAPKRMCDVPRRGLTRWESAGSRLLPRLYEPCLVHISVNCRIQVQRCAMGGLRGRGPRGRIRHDVEQAGPTETQTGRAIGPSQQEFGERCGLGLAAQAQTGDSGRRGWSATDPGRRLGLRRGESRRANSVGGTRCSSSRSARRYTPRLKKITSLRGCQ